MRPTFPVAVLLSTAALWAQAPVKITSPATGIKVVPGETITFGIHVWPWSRVKGVAIAGPEPIGMVPAFSATPYVEWLRAPYHQVLLRIPDQTPPRKYQITAVAQLINEDVVASDPITIDVIRPGPSDFPARKPSIFEILTGQSLRPAETGAGDLGGNPLSVTLSQTSATVYQFASLYLHANVRNDRFEAPDVPQVQWTIHPAVGFIHSLARSGDQYTAPINLDRETTVTVTATSLTDPAKTASAILKVTPTPLNPRP